MIKTSRRLAYEDFWGDSDNRDFSRTNRYAYLNWWFDNGYGENQSPCQHIFDNYHMGKAFIGNALLSLNCVLETSNPMSVADKLIFPIFFNSWHGLELWLKSSVSALNLLTRGELTHSVGHQITQLLVELETILKVNDCNDIILKVLAPTKVLIEEFNKVGANFDFARYSFDVKGNYQFYNAPYNSDKQWQSPKFCVDKNIVPNTCVDLCNLFELLAMIFEEFGSFVEYLTLCITAGGVVSDKYYFEYTQDVEDSEKIFYKYEAENATPSEIILKAIMK